MKTMHTLALSRHSNGKTTGIRIDIAVYVRTYQLKYVNKYCITIKTSYAAT